MTTKAKGPLARMEELNRTGQAFWLENIIGIWGETILRADVHSVGDGWIEIEPFAGSDGGKRWINLTQVASLKIVEG